MADTKETAIAEPAATTAPDTLSAEEPTGGVNLPAGWMYRQRKIGSLRIPWYASPKSQLLMVSFVCFLCPGMFNALSGLGGGGKSDATLADNMVKDLSSIL
jgi:hypothetical protein